MQDFAYRFSKIFQKFCLNYRGRKGHPFFAPPISPHALDIQYSKSLFTGLKSGSERKT